MILDHSPTVIEFVYERDEELDAKALATADLDPLDMMPDRLQAEIELAYERDEEFDASGQATGDTSMATIAYEEAIERELEYQKRKKLTSLQPSPDSSFLSTSSQFRQPPFWCNTCKLNCERVLPISRYRQGRKQRNKLEEIHTGKKHIPVHNTEMLWCKECNVPCMNKMALAQHRAIKKHIAIIQALQVKNGAPGAGMI